MSRGIEEMRSDLDGLRSEVRQALDRADRESDNAKRNGVFIAILVALIGAAGSVGGAVVDSLKADPVACSESYERAAELHSNGVTPIFPDESPEQQQCDINGFIETLP
jgi:hypothetical protein